MKYFATTLMLISLALFATGCPEPEPTPPEEPVPPVEDPVEPFDPVDPVEPVEPN